MSGTVLPPSLYGAPGALPGHLADNVVHFARVLRAAGVPVGTDRALLALQALQVAGIASRRDFHAVLASCLIDRAEHRELFEQAFHVFWKDPDLLGQMMRMLLPEVTSKAGGAPPPEHRRLAEALFQGEQPPAPSAPPPEQRLEIDAQLSWSEREQLRKTDFDTMSAAEWIAARRMLQQLEPFLVRLATRRSRPATRGTRIDLRAALRTAARQGGAFAALPRRERLRRPAPLVALVDISGSVSRYSRMFLHFLHALTNADLRIHAFVFGTRLTPVTRALRARDPDVAVAAVVAAVDDWSGGTRIAACLKTFNVQWARRVLSGSPTVLLMTDGLEQGDIALLESQVERLAKSCRQLVWLNPLLRYDAFEPKARGIRAMLPHVDRMVAAHNIDSLAGLARLLAQQNAGRAPSPARGRGPR
jgi:hypothetical protein